VRCEWDDCLYNDSAHDHSERACMRVNRLPSIRRRALTHYYEQLATLLGAGVPVGRAFATLSETATNERLRRFSSTAEQSTHKGRSLQEIFGEAVGLFGTMAVHLIVAAEASGRVPEALKLLARQTAREREFRSRLVAGLAYPVFLLHAAVLLISAISVIPAGGGFDAFLLKVGRTLVPGYFCVFGGHLLWRVLHRVAFAALVLDAVVLRIPFMGRIVRASCTARFCRVYANLTEAGASASQALGLAAEASGNTYLAAALARGSDYIDSGRPLSEYLAGKRVLFRQLTAMLRTGEESGRVPEMLNRMADSAEFDVATSLKRISVILPFIVYVTVAGFIGYFVLKFWAGFYGSVMSQ